MNNRTTHGLSDETTIAYHIVPNTKQYYDTITAASPEEAITEFATYMDLDMNAYFNAIPVNQSKKHTYLCIAQAAAVRDASIYVGKKTDLESNFDAVYNDQLWKDIPAAEVVLGTYTTDSEEHAKETAASLNGIDINFIYAVELNL